MPVPLLKTISEEETAKIFVERAERELEADASAYRFANWNYQTNLTDENQKVKLAAAETSGLLSKRLGKEAQGFDVQQITDVDINRKLKLIKDLGTSALPDENLKKYNKLLSDMGSTFSKAKVGHRIW